MKAPGSFYDIPGAFHISPLFSERLILARYLHSWLMNDFQVPKREVIGSDPLRLYAESFWGKFYPSN